MNDTRTLSFEELRGQAETIREDVGIKVSILGDAGLQIDQYFRGLAELGFDPRAIRSGIGDGMSYQRVTTIDDSTDLAISAR